MTIRTSFMTGAVLALATFLLTSAAGAAELTNGLGMVLVEVAPGDFVMGKDQNADSDEGPSHAVSITRPFLIGKFEVTQGQWAALMEGNPSQFQDPDAPVDSVSWEDAQTFVFRLNQKEGTDAYRLPTEAEWEYAARAGTSGDYYFGEASALGDHAWFAGNSENHTHPVGQKLPNPWGLHDIYGNVYEWVSDLYSKDYYSNSPASDPQGPGESMDQYRSLRGGCFSCAPFFNRSSFRSFYGQDTTMDTVGFRVAMTPR